ncbi:MAG: hypothetical protein IAG13_12945 [Deltaproteobacteria bacterium]|nr:hypothetical protein [Nannocystaceae bacterium]
MSIRLQILLRSSCAFAFSTALAVACGDDSGEGDEEHGQAEPQVCKDISSVCHDLDDGSGMAHECHETAHAGEAAACEAIHDECIAFCAGGSGSETGTATGSTGATASESSTVTTEPTGSSGTDHGSSEGTTGGHDESSSGDHGSSSETAGTACDVLGSGCHDVDTPEAQACHDIGHDDDVMACEDALAECTKICGL